MCYLCSHPNAWLVWGVKRDNQLELVGVYIERIHANAYADYLLDREPDHWREVYIEGHRICDPPDDEHTAGMI